MDLPDYAVIPEARRIDDALAAVVALRRTAEQLELAAVRSAIEQGWSWAQVAQALGVSKQAAHRKHARRIRTTEG